MKILLQICLIFRIIFAQEENILCSTTYCEDYITTSPCADLPTKCNIQNSTHNGLFLPSPFECNCCEYCLENLDEGDSCAMGQIGSPNPSSICGSGLACDNGICRRMNTPCTQKQDEYDEKRDNGTLGHLEVRAKCDEDGLFVPYHCIPGQTCYCVDENGNRLFGEIDFTDTASFILKCQCSRKYEAAVAVIGRALQPYEHFRCTETGDYDVVQCIGNNCLCVDAADGAPTYPDRSTVNMSLISTETLPCFNADIHTVGKFYHKCAEEYIGILDEIQDLTDSGYNLVFGYEFPNCSLDGKYNAVQETATTKFCSDSDGNQIENYAVDKSDTLATAGMDCKCARSRLIATSTELPDCCPNGNFKKVQCRRGLCRCVDADGNQIEKENATPELLSCYENSCVFE